MSGPTQQILEQVRNLISVELELPDEALLQRFRDATDEAAFEALVRRHGPMVLGVCRRALRDHHTAEDAFQATFLILARKASSVRCSASLRCWLHGVAARLARKVRESARRRDRKEEAAVARTG